MDRRCIICGLEPGKQCVYPRNMTEAKRWQNLAKLGSFDVDTESLCKHGCVCTLHLGTDQEYGSHPASTRTPDAVCSRRRPGGKISRSPTMKWFCLEKDCCQPDEPPPNCCPYPTNNKPNGGMQVKSKQENSNVNGCNIGLHRCRAAQIQGNLHSQMRNNCYHQQSTGSTIGTAPDQNLKPSQPTVPVLCACINYPIPRDPNAVSEEASCPLMRNPSPAPAPCYCKCSRQRSPKNTQNHSQQRPRSCDRLPSCACNRQQFQSSSDFNSSLSSSTGQSSSPTSDSHQEMMPDVKDKCTCKCNRQRSPKNTQTQSQQRPRSCDRLPSCACNKQQFQSSNYSSLSSSTGQSNSTTSDSHQEIMPDVKDVKCTCKCNRQRSPKNTQTQSQQRPRSCDPLPSCACNKQQFQSSVSDDRNIKASQPTVPVLCACINYPIPPDLNAVSEKSWCPLMQSPSPAPAPAPCNCNCSRQRSSKNTQTHSQQRPKSCDRLTCFAYNKQKFQSLDFTSSLSSSTGPSSSTTSESHQEMKAEVKDESCQTSVNCQLKDQEVQCSKHSLQPNDTSAAVTADTSTQPKEILITEKCDCDCDRSTSSATRYDGRASSKSVSYTANIEMPNFEYAGGEEQQYSVNAVNVLLMNGSRQKPYEGPNPEICVLASDLADCNERAVFPEVDKPTYRLCRAATSGPDTKGEQDEANVLVLGEDSMNGCSPEDLNSHQGQQSQSEQQFMEGINSNQNQCNCRGQIDDNWINSSCSSNYTKLLELQRSRINELENLLQQHNKLQQTIQARMTELQCQEI